MPKYSEWIHSAAKKITDAGIPSGRLDAELILAHTLRKNRTFIHAHSDDSLDIRHFEIAEARVRLRLDRTPIAYIIGHKEFYGRLFKVTPATLIPRPESEPIIDLLKEVIRATPQSLLDEDPKHLIDVGTGSGCLGITAKLELPELEVTLSDISHHALRVAEANAKTFDSQVTTLQSNLLESYSFTPDFILANLPYVDRSWERSPETQYEPEIALFAEDAGLHLIYKLIEEAQTRLSPKGSLILEADTRQHPALIKFASRHGFARQKTAGLIVLLQKA